MAAKDSKTDEEKIEAEKQAELHEVVRNFFENLGLLNQPENFSARSINYQRGYIE